MKQKQLIQDNSGAIQYALEKLEWIVNHCKVNGDESNPHKIRTVAAEAIEEIKRMTGASE